MGRRSDHTRAQIRAMALQATRDLLIEEGPQALTARNIAAAIGYTPGTLYLVFDNLDHLVRIVNEETVDELSGTVFDVLSGQAGGRERVEGFVGACLDYARRQPRKWQLLCESISLGQPRAPAAGLVEDLMRPLLAAFRDLNAGAGAGESEACVAILWAALTGLSRGVSSHKLLYRLESSHAVRILSGALVGLAAGAAETGLSSTAAR